MKYLIFQIEEGAPEDVLQTFVEEIMEEDKKWEPVVFKDIYFIGTAEEFNTSLTKSP